MAHEHSFDCSGHVNGPRMVMYGQNFKYLGDIVAIYPELWLYIRPDGTLAMISNTEIRDGKE